MCKQLFLTVLLLLFTALLVSPLCAQTLPGHRPIVILNQNAEPTDAQKALLNQVKGVGSIKFGATVESFLKGVLQQIGSPYVQPYARQVSYRYLKPGDISWGTLHPKDVELNFRGNQLVVIWLKLEEPLGTLVTVRKALVEKYGPSSMTMEIHEPSSPGASGSAWNAGRIFMGTTLPEEPVRLDEVNLDSPTTATVEISDQFLIMSLVQKDTESAKKRLSEEHDLEKIKADL